MKAPECQALCSQERRRRLFVYLSRLAQSVAGNREENVQAPAENSRRRGRGSPHRQRPAGHGPGGEGQGGKQGKSAPPLLLAESWDFVTEPPRLVADEARRRRAFWDGKQFWSRLGNRFHAPDWFVKGLPDVPLDGELWLGRKKFQRTVSTFAVRTRPTSGRKSATSSSTRPRKQKPSRNVWSWSATSSRPKSRLRHRHPHELCQGVEHLRAELTRLEMLGGEGLIDAAGRLQIRERPVPPPS